MPHRMFTTRSITPRLLRRAPAYRAMLVWMLALLSLTAPAFGQTEAAKPRPKIGLALSGGSALGLTEIGVLEWFDQHHIPIDYISGTSMGGIMGGGFAIGMTPEELKSTLREIDWNKVLSGEPPYRNLPLRRKEDLHDLQSRLVVGLRSGVELPGGISSANPINLLLSRICLPYSELKSFDALPTPFRCVAVDMQKGEAVALKDGSLATALRATMAIPGFFLPVERDGTLYTDGATLNNIPTEAVKEMGAEIIIAVDLSSSFLNEKPPRSLLAVLGRTITIATYANERRSLKLADIVLTPDVQGVSLGDFTQVDALAKRGYKAAEDRSKILEKLALNAEEWQAYTAQRNARKRVAVPTPAFIEVIGVKGKPAQDLAQQLHRFVHQPLNTSDLEQSLTAITGQGRFNSFFYDLTLHGDQSGLRIRPTENSNGPSLLRFGLGINGADANNIQTNLAARLTARDIGAPGAEVRADLRVGSNRDAAIEYYRPLAGQRPFFAPRIYLQDDSFGLFDSGARVATYSSRKAGAGLDLGYNTNPDSQLRLGYLFEHQEASVSTGSKILPSLHGDISALRLNWLYDGQDSPTIPTRGVRFTAEARWYLYAPDAPRPFPSLGIALSSFHPVGRGDSVFGVLGAGTSFGSRAAALQQFTVGGPGSLAAYGPDEFRGNDSLNLSLGYLHHVAQLPPYLGGKVMLTSSFQVGGAFQRFGSGRYLDDVALGVLAETLIGPISIGYSYGEAGRSRIFFAIGGLF